MRATPSQSHGEGARALDGLVAVAAQEWLDDEWNFRLLVPQQHKARPGPPTPPPEQMLQPLAYYQLDGTEAQVEVRASKLTREVDAGDWLTSSSVLKTKEVVEGVGTDISSAGATVDAQWESRGVPYCGRYACIKSGPRMFLITCTAPRKRWSSLEPLVETMFDSFEPVTEPPHRYAERLRSYVSKKPVPWKVRLPASWVLEPGSQSDVAASFQAENVNRPRGGRGEMVGKLAFAILDRSLHATPRSAAELYLDAVRDHGIDVGADTVELEPSRAPFTQSWLLVAPVWRDELPGEVRCRVMCHERVWALAGVLTPRPTDDLPAWMQNKRALDLLMLSLRLES